MQKNVQKVLKKCLSHIIVAPFNYHCKYVPTFKVKKLDFFLNKWRKKRYGFDCTTRQGSHEAETFDAVTVYFSAIHGFSTLAATDSPSKVSILLPPWGKNRLKPRA